MGDVFWLSSNGVSETVMAVRRVDASTVEVTAQKLDANAAEFCERYEQLEPQSAKWKSCIREGRSGPKRLLVNCRTATIVTDTGSYRRSEDDFWKAVGQENWFIRADDFFRKTCRR